MLPLRKETTHDKSSSEQEQGSGQAAEGRQAEAGPCGRPCVGGRHAEAGSQTPTASPQLSKPASKRDQLATLLVRNEGATIAQMQEATGWLPHTVRAALTGLKKLGYAIDSDKIDGLRTYRAVAPE